MKIVEVRLFESKFPEMSINVGLLFNSGNVYTLKLPNKN